MKIATLLIFSLTLFSCKKKEVKTEWYAAMSRPVFHPIEGPKVVYFNKGKMIAGTSTLTDTGAFGWNFPAESRSVSFKNIFPDSITVNYGGLNDKLQMCSFGGGCKLPVNKIKELFDKGYNAFDRKKEFNFITTGLAPGGRVCVWVDHVEVMRFTVKQLEVYSQVPVITFGDSIEVINYLEKHPIDYSVWEHPDSQYTLDFGFCSEENNIQFKVVYFFSKEGIRNVVTERQIDLTNWDIPYGKMADYSDQSYQQIDNTSIENKSQFPTEVQIKWDFDSQICDTRVLLPDKIKHQFIKPYIDSKTGKRHNYNRIVFGVEKDGEYCIVWLDGPGKQEKIMRFRGKPSLKDEKGEYLNRGSYATEVQYY